MYKWIIRFLANQNTVEESAVYSGDIYDDALKAFRNLHPHDEIVNVKRAL